MNTEKGWDFWAVFALLVVMMGFMLSMNARMATKADIARVEANFKADIARVESEIKDIRNLLIDHIKDRHDHKKQDRQPASESEKSKSK